jgi:hypothetical protein
MTAQNSPNSPKMRDIIGATDEHIKRRLAASALRGKSAKDKYEDFTFDLDQSRAQQCFDLLISELAWGSTIFRVEVSLIGLEDSGAVKAFGIRYLESKGYVCKSAQATTLPTGTIPLEFVDFYVDWELTEKAVKGEPPAYSSYRTNQIANQP